MAQAATPGPWEYTYYEPYEAGIEASGKKLEGITVWLDDAPVPDFNLQVNNNAEFIAALDPDTVLKLIAVVEAGQEVLDFVNPVFLDENPCLKLREALAAVKK